MSEGKSVQPLLRRIGAGLGRLGGAGLGSAAVGRASKKPGKPLTPLNCMRILARHGWIGRGAGPNYSCIYMDLGEERIALMVTAAETVTPNAIRAVMEDYRLAEYAAGRQAVAVYRGEAHDSIIEAAATEGLTLVHVDALDQLPRNLAATQRVAAIHHEAAIRAQQRRYDAPVPAEMTRRDTADGILLETEEVAVTLRDRGGETLLITFANQWHKFDGRTLWGDSLAKALNLSLLGFVAKSPNWYPLDDMASLIPAVAAALEGRFGRRVAFGQSQGGYGALKYSRALGATDVLACAPQYALDSRIVADSRVNKYYTGRWHAGMAVTSADLPENGSRVFVIYDPFDEADARHVASLAANAAVQLLRTPFAGHGSDRGLANAAVFAEILALAAQGDASGLQRLLAAGRAKRPERAVLMALAAAQKHPPLATAILTKFADGWTPNQIGGVCFRLAKAGHAASVLPHVVQTAQRKPESAEAQGIAALVALELRELKLAQHFVGRAIALEAFSAKWLDVAKRVEELSLKLAKPYEGPLLGNGLYRAHQAAG